MSYTHKGSGVCPICPAGKEYAFEHEHKEEKGIMWTGETHKICSNCSKPLGKLAVLSPTTDPKRTNQCPDCADAWMREQKEWWQNERFVKIGAGSQFYEIWDIPALLAEAVERHDSSEYQRGRADAKKEVEEILEAVKNECGTVQVLYIW
jgi:hypothetical protein